MDIDFCDISTSFWWLSALLFLAIGAALGFAGYSLVKLIWNRSSLTGGQASIGCLVPIVSGPTVCYAVFTVLPLDPCEGGHTADAIFLPIWALILVAAASMTSFLLRAWRNL
jgi:hypothetical protein